MCYKHTEVKVTKLASKNPAFIPMRFCDLIKKNEIDRQHEAFVLYHLLS